MTRLAVDELDDPVACAEAAGLRYVTDQDPGIRRRRCGRGFTFLALDGATVATGERARIIDLAIPPAWTDVWIAPDPADHLQATGRDDRGRKQYLYHPAWRELRDEQKFTRLVGFADRLNDLRTRVEEDVAGEGLTERRVLAAVVRLLDTTLIRVGGEQYAADNDTFGATTLEPRHAVVARGRCRLEFTAKGGAERAIEVDDPQVVEVIVECIRRDQPQLFCFESDRLVDVTAGHVNAYLSDIAAPEVTAKTFRTWGATRIAVAHLATTPDGGDQSLAAIDAAAAALGNTRAVCRSAYVAPRVLEAAATGELQRAWSASRSSRHRSRAESATAKVLAAA